MFQSPLDHVHDAEDPLIFMAVNMKALEGIIHPGPGPTTPDPSGGVLPWASSSPPEGTGSRSSASVGPRASLSDGGLQRWCEPLPVYIKGANESRILGPAPGRQGQRHDGKYTSLNQDPAPLLLGNMAALLSRTTHTHIGMM